MWRRFLHWRGEAQINDTSIKHLTLMSVLPICLWYVANNLVGELSQSVHGGTSDGLMATSAMNTTSTPVDQRCVRDANGGFGNCGAKICKVHGDEGGARVIGTIDVRCCAPFRWREHIECNRGAKCQVRRLSSFCQSSSVLVVDFSNLSTFIQANGVIYFMP